MTTVAIDGRFFLFFFSFSFLSLFVWGDNIMRSGLTAASSKLAVGIVDVGHLKDHPGVPETFQEERTHGGCGGQQTAGASLGQDLVLRREGEKG